MDKVNNPIVKMIWFYEYLYSFDSSTLPSVLSLHKRST